MSVAETVRTYGAAWGETDEKKRLQLLEQAWAEGGRYTDPQSDVTGREALSTLIAGFHKQVPGARIEEASGVEVHHGYFRFAWKLMGPDGNAMIEGFDVGELADDGRIKLIVGFFGPFPPA